MVSTHDNWIATATGRQVNLRYPVASSIVIEDIALGLSNVCRFSGQTALFFSVAEHSVSLALYFKERNMPVHAKLALLHDASEAYLGDVPAPAKVLLPDYKRTERELTGAIMSAFDLLHAWGGGWVNHHITDPGCKTGLTTWGEVMQADHRACVTEFRDINPLTVFCDTTPEDFIEALRPRFLPPDQARSDFMYVYRELFD